MKINVTMEMTPQEVKEMLNVPDIRKILEEHIDEEIRKALHAIPKIPDKFGPNPLDMIGPGLIEGSPLWKNWEKTLYTNNPWMTGPTAKED